MSEDTKLKLHGWLIVVLVLGVCVAIGYGMSTTANNDPQTVCLTRPWLDIKPPC